jgi:hypothetical protein
MRAGAKNRQGTQAKGSAKGSRRRVPRNLEEAFKKGWTIREDLESWQFKGSNKRDGFLVLALVLEKKGETRTLMVRLMALYQLGTPYFLNG